MCGRTAMTLAPAETMKQVDAKKWVNGHKDYGCSYNVGPTRGQPIIIKKKPRDIEKEAKSLEDLENIEWPPKYVKPEEDEDIKKEEIKEEQEDSENIKAEIKHEPEIEEEVDSDPSEEAVRAIYVAQWGVIPGYAKIPKISYNTINARSDTITDSSVWRRLYKRKRCIALANGYFEWRTTDNKKSKDRQPFYIRRKDGQLIRFAALYDVWVSSEDKTQKMITYAIVTVPAHPDLEHIHSRMPAMLKTLEEEEKWLENDADADPATYLSLLQPVGKEFLEWSEADPRMGNIRFQGPQCINYTKPLGITAFFQASPKKPAKQQPEETAAVKKDLSQIGDHVEAATSAPEAIKQENEQEKEKESKKEIEEGKPTQSKRKRTAKEPKEPSPKKEEESREEQPQRTLRKRPAKKR